MTLTEEWRAAVGYEGCYEVSSLGRVRSVERRVYAGRGRTRVNKARIISLFTGETYPKACFKVEGKQHSVYAHRLVAAAFIGPCPEGMEVCHNNGMPSDNRVENLRYDTHAANLRDTLEHGTNHFARRTHCVKGHEFTPENTRPRPSGGRVCRTCERERARTKNPMGRRVGEDNPKAKLTEAAVREVRAAYADGETMTALSQQFGVSRPTVRGIVTGLTWRHVA